jgi:hypothetical protein
MFIRPMLAGVPGVAICDTRYGKDGINGVETRVGTLLACQFKAVDRIKLASLQFPRRIFR